VLVKASLFTRRQVTHLSVSEGLIVYPKASNTSQF